MWKPDANFEASWNGKPALQFTGWPAFLMIIALAIVVAAGVLSSIVSAARVIGGA